MSRAVVVGAGSCLLEAIIAGLHRLPCADDEAELHLSQLQADGRVSVPEDVLARCTVLIEEACPLRRQFMLSEAERALLPADCATILVPTLHMNSLWPLMTEDPRNVPEPGAPYGRIPRPFADKLALQVREETRDPARRMAAYLATDVLAAAGVAEAHELWMGDSFAREHGCDIKIAAYMLHHFRELRLFYTHGHPTGRMMAYVLAQIIGHPAMREVFTAPLDAQMQAVRDWGRRSGVFVGEEAPIHPAVAAHFGLEWYHPRMVFRWLHRDWSFEDWLAFLLTYEPEVAKAAE